MSRTLLGLVMSVLLLGYGCGGDDTPPGPADTGPAVDSGSTDAGPTDTGAADAGAAVCGDRRITAPEECDDGNTTPGDGCDGSCMIETSATCGDGTVDRPGEQCDDGGTVDGDGCSARCLIEAPTGCGDGTLDLTAGEECDDGGLLPGDGCSPTCQLEAVGAFCGDSMMDPGEVCDDGNTINGDGCNPTCNLTGNVTLFVGEVGMPGSADGAPGAARIRGFGTIAADDSSLWYAEGGGAGGMAALRRVDIATRTITTVATLPGPGAEGIATNGTDMVWIATNDGTGPAIYSVSTAAPFPVARVTGSAPCMATGCYAAGLPGTATFAGIRGLTWYAGSLYIVDPPAGVIRRLNTSTGEVFDVAGDPFNPGYMDGAAAVAQFRSPRYIVSDGSGLLYVSETNGSIIREVNATTGMVTTFAGNATQGYVDAPGTAARIHRPRGITSDGSSVYWVEFNAHTVRQGILATQEVSTVAGTVTTCTGGGMCAGLMCRGGVCLPGGGGPVGGGYAVGIGTAASFQAPFSIAFHFPSNSLFVVDSGNNVIRRIQ